MESPTQWMWMTKCPVNHCIIWRHEYELRASNGGKQLIFGVQSWVSRAFKVDYIKQRCFIVNQ
jgi:hypothetical protein